MLVFMLNKVFSLSFFFSLGRATGLYALAVKHTGRHARITAEYANDAFAGWITIVPGVLNIADFIMCLLLQHFPNFAEKIYCAIGNMGAIGEFNKCELPSCLK